MYCDWTYVKFGFCPYTYTRTNVLTMFELAMLFVILVFPCIIAWMIGYVQGMKEAKKQLNNPHGN